MPTLEDSPRHGAFREAIEATLQQLEAEDKDARVLILGCGAGKMPSSLKYTGMSHMSACLAPSHKEQEGEAEAERDNITSINI